MKYLIIVLILFFCLRCEAQPLSLVGTLPSSSDCGTVKDSIYYSEWQSIDTLGIVNDSARVWVYNITDEPIGDNKSTFAVYCPCGCLWDDNWYQYRICKITGIQERRIKTKTYIRIPPPTKPKTEYQQTVESFSNEKITKHSP